MMLEFKMKVKIQKLKRIISINMQKEITDYINTQRVGVLAVEMLDGSPHATTVHFAFDNNTQIFYFETYKEYKKAEALFGRAVSRASFVIGTSEDTKITLQIDGEVSLIKDEEKSQYDSIYFNKFPNKIEKSKDPKFVCFKFIPKNWKFTDWSNPQGKLILTSNS